MRRGSHCVIFLCLASTYVSGQLGVPQFVTFGNKMIPHVLQGLSFDHENIVYSPFGLATSLAMVLDGVSVRIATQISNTLGLGGPNARQLIRQGSQTLLTSLQDSLNEEDKIGSYNRAYVHSSKPLIPEYQNILETYYMATVANNISDEATDLVLDLQTDTGVMTHWKDYDKLAVYTYLSHLPAAPFITPNGTILQVPMIPQIGSFRAGYIPRLNSQAVELPLSVENAALLLIMPDYKDGISEVLVKLVSENIARIASKLPFTDAEVTLPQFAIVSPNLDVGKVLKKSGLDYIFTSKSGKSSSGPVRSIKQNAYFATSFIAVNSVVSGHSTLYKSTVKKERRKRETVATSFTFNKPFIFLLMNKPSGMAILAGVVKVPHQVPES